MSQLSQGLISIPVLTITGDAGGAVGASGAGNINLTGTGVVVTGTPATNTLNIAAGGALAASFVTDVGTATPLLGVLNVLGADNINTSAAGNFLYVHVDDKIVLPATNAGDTDGSYAIGSGGTQCKWHAYGTDNVFLGRGAGNLTLNVGVSSSNVGIGAGNLNGLTTGANNSAFGTGVLQTITTGSNNISIGYSSGSAYTTLESSNITIANAGVLGESNKIRIGTQGAGAGQQNATYIAGIYGVTPGGTLNVALVDSNHQLGSVANLAVAQGGTGAGTFTAHGVLLGNTTSAFGVTAEGATGTILTGVTGANPTWTTATYPSTVAQGDLLCASAPNVIGVVAGSTAGYVLTANGVGAAPTYQAAVSHPGGVDAWTEVTGATVSLAVNNGYIMNRGTAITATLPATAAQGSVIRISGKGAGLTVIAQNAGQTVHFDGTDTTAGAGGSLTATGQYDCIEFLCITANTDFVVLSSVGNWTIV